MKAPDPLYYHYKKTLATLDGPMKCHVPHSWKIFGPCDGQEIQSHRRQCTTCRTFLEVTMWENTVESFGFLSAAIYSVQSLASCDREWVSEHGFHGVAGGFYSGVQVMAFYDIWLLMWSRADVDQGFSRKRLCKSHASLIVRPWPTWHPASWKALDLIAVSAAEQYPDEILCSTWWLIRPWTIENGPGLLVNNDGLGLQSTCWSPEFGLHGI